MNKIVGERTIKLGEHELVLRPSFNNLISAESALDKSYVQIFDDLRAGRPRIKDIASIIYHCKNKDDKLTQEEVGELLVSSPLHTASAIVFEMIVFVLAGGAEEKKTEQSQ